jgi:hypothetical protein
MKSSGYYSIFGAQYNIVIPQNYGMVGISLTQI